MVPEFYWVLQDLRFSWSPTAAHRGSEEAVDSRAEGTAHVALGGAGLVQEADLQGNGALRAQIQALQLLVAGPVPHVDAGSIVTCQDKCGWVHP